MNDSTKPTTEHAKSGIKWDLTVNVPTVSTLLIAALTSAVWIASKWQDMDTRVIANATANAALKEAVSRLEASATEQRRDQVQKLDAMRSEVRGDMRDMGNKLDTLLQRGINR